MRRPALVSLLALATACGGSSGRRGDTTPPAIAAAVFVGAGATPVAGEVLRLFFDEPITVADGALLTDADLTLGDGGTLGAVTAPPTLLDSRTVAVTLGSGVALAPGMTTVALSPDNDVILDLAGNRGVGGSAVVLTKGDGDAPVITAFTASGVDATLNGQGSAGGTLQVPTTGFTIDLAYSDATSTVVPAFHEIMASVPVQADGQQLAAGSNLRGALQPLEETASAASYLVPATMTFPAGDVVLTALVRDDTGMTSSAATFTLRTVTPTDSLRPFETTVNASQVWYLDTTRDLESYTLVPTGGTTFDVVVQDGPNGRTDLLDVLALIGLVGSDDATNTASVERLQAVVLTELDRLFGGANVAFTFTSPGTFPPQPSVAYGSHGFSQIAVAGAASHAGVLGLALFDPHNDSQDNDCLTDFQASRLGVFLVTVLDNINGFGGPSTTLFRQTYDPLRGEVGGTPIGGDAQDAARIAGSVTDGRATTIHNAINRFARFIAVVVAHETGHSMGLVKNGAMPAGLYGGDPTNFPGSNSEHIRMPTTVFPSGSVNVMSPALNFELAQNGHTAFNSLNLAYLRERALYNR